MFSQVLRRTAARRAAWHKLGEFASAKSDVATFRNMRALDSQVESAAATGAAPKVDFAAAKASISHVDLVDKLQAFHDSEMARLAAAAKGDHKASVGAQMAADTEGWTKLHDAGLEECRDAVKASENIVANGAKALYISHNNPAVSQVSQSEWLDVDQYWQAFVEKHQHYHDHLCSVTEDPESKEHDEKLKQDLLNNWQRFDGKPVERANNKQLYQRPSHEYYDLYRGALVEHMIYYLVRAGGDARFFPEMIPHSWHCAIYDARHRLYSVLQRRKRATHEGSLSRVANHDLHPASLADKGDVFYANMAARHNALTEATTARLMGNFLLFSDDEFIPVQTRLAAERAMETDSGKGTFYSIGPDINALFYKPARALEEVSPVKALNCWLDHLNMTGRRLPAGIAAIADNFTRVLEERKPSLRGAWFAAPGESSKNAFLRRLKEDDPSRPIFEAYAREHSERFAAAKEVKLEEVIEEVERRYTVECETFTQGVVPGLVDDAAAKEALEQTALAGGDESAVQGALDGGELQAWTDQGARVTKAAELLAIVTASDGLKDRAVEAVNAAKVSL